jgi:hypothetical protein
MGAGLVKRWVCGGMMDISDGKEHSSEEEEHSQSPGKRMLGFFKVLMLALCIFV